MTEREVRRRVRDRLPWGDVLPAVPDGPRDPGAPFVQITSTTQTDGRYPGTLYLRENWDTAASFTALGDAGGIWVDTPNGETLLTGVYIHVRLVGVKSADGKPVFEVLGIPFPMLRGKLDGALSYQGSATMSVWSGTGAGSDTGVNVTVYDWVLSSGQTVDAGKQVVATWDAASGIYVLHQAQCA